MKRIDAHQHFWKYDAVRDSWITDDMAVIQKDFLPGDLLPILNANNIDGCVAVQADQSENENDFLIQLAGENNFIKGVVGWVNLQAEDVAAQLAKYQQHKIVKGFRHVLQGEADRALMLQPNFKRGIGYLQQFGYTYDILIYTDQLQYIEEFVAAFPNQKFVIDHLAKPNIKAQQIDEWKQYMHAIAKHENVCCKVSGMVTEADWKHWKPSDFHPYLDVITEAFGTKRIMYGSDWPVCLVAAEYGQMLDIVKAYFASFSQHEQDLFFGGNAITFYNL